MIPYPEIDPEIVRVGPFALRWYGLMYVLGFAASWLLIRYRLRKAGGTINGQRAADDFLSSLISWVAAGLILGARLGYVLFYNPMEYLQRPWAVFAVWEGGMSFHGGLIGAVLAGVLCCRKYGADPWAVADLVIPTAPIGLGLGRLGNFINSELYGRVTDVPWAMVFPSAGPLPRHPSQLYEFLLEGVLLFTVLWLVKDRVRPSGSLIALFLVLYGTLRIFAEFFREPDPQLGFVLGPFTMGQVLSAIMVVVGLILFSWRRMRAS